MRVDTDDLERAQGRKKVGRKHNHQPRGRAHQRMLMRPILRERLRNAARQKWNALVRKYWLGEIDNFPPAEGG